jgi:hypothetical protein
MISIVTIKQIEQKFNKEIRYPSDCEALAGDILHVTKQAISTSTLKRIFGFIAGSKEPRLYTLDVIAQYLGYSNWDNYIENQLNIDNSDFLTIKQVEIEKLAPNSIVEISYAPESKLILNYRTNFEFEIKHAVNSKLQENDLLKIFNIVKDYPLIINAVTRNNVNLGSYKAAKISGVTEINILEQ